MIRLTDEVHVHSPRGAAIERWYFVVGALILALAILAVLWPREARADIPPEPTVIVPLGSIDRLALGADAVGGIVEHGSGLKESAALPRAWASYNLTSRFAVAGVYEHWTRSRSGIATAGLRAKLASLGAGELAAGLSAVYYGGPGTVSVLYSIHGNWPLLESEGRVVVALIGSGAYDPGEDGGARSRKDYRAGLRYQAFGGR